MALEVIHKWVYLDMTSNSGKILYACTRCGHVTPAPTRHHVCSPAQLEMNQHKAGNPLPESVFEH